MVLPKSHVALLRRTQRVALKASSHEDGQPWGFEWVDGKPVSSAAARALYREGYLCWEERPAETSHADIKGVLVATSKAPLHL